MELTIDAQIVLIDECDIELLVGTWHIKKFGGTHPYVFRGMFKKPRTLSLHRLILARKVGRELLPHEYVDHIDGNTLNNQRSNLRLATPQQNTVNSKLSIRNTSGYKGVTWNKKSHKWQAGIKVNRKSYHLGLFDNPLDAHEAYKRKAIEFFGEFVRFES